MNRKLSSYEELLVELVHLISYSSPREMGLNLREVKQFLNKPIASRDGKTCLDLLSSEGRIFLNELRVYINEMERKR